MPREEDPAIDELLAALRAALERGRGLGSRGAERLGAGADEAMRSLLSRRVERALRTAPDTFDAASLAAALEPSSSAAGIAGRAGSLGRRFAGRSRIAGAVARRSPTGLALRWGPLLVDVVRSNLRAVDAVAAHLVARARRAGVEPAPERVRTVVVQALAGLRLDPDAQVDHTALARVWLRDTGRRALPFGFGGRGSAPSAAEVVGALAELDVGRLGTA